MIRLKKYYIINLIILFCMLISGCSNNKDKNYNKFMDDFYNLYFQIAEVVNTTSAKDIIILRTSSDIQEKMDSIKSLLDETQDKVPENKEANFKKLKEWYSELVELSDKKI